MTAQWAQDKAREIAEIWECETGTGMDRAAFSRLCQDITKALEEHDKKCREEERAACAAVVRGTIPGCQREQGWALERAAKAIEERE